MNATGPIRLALFDMNGVVYVYDRAERIRRLAAATGLAADVIDARIWGEGLEDAADAGAFPTPESHLAAWRARLGVPLALDEWIDACAAGLKPIPETIAVVDRLIAAGLAVGVLTNNGPLIERYRHHIAPEIAARCEGRFLVSSAFRLGKPDPAVYAAALDRLGFAPAETVFIDDRQDNVDGARAAGLVGLLYESPAQLATALAALGCL